MAGRPPSLDQDMGRMIRASEKAPRPVPLWSGARFGPRFRTARVRSSHREIENNSETPIMRLFSDDEPPSKPTG